MLLRSPHKPSASRLSALALSNTMEHSRLTKQTSVARPPSSPTTRNDWPLWRRSQLPPFHSGLWVAWGFETGFKNGHLTPYQFAQRAKLQGFRWATLELDDYNNAPRWAEFRTACHAFGLLAGPWFTEGGNVALTPTDSDFTIAEAESENDRLGILAAMGSLPEGMRRAVVTNFTPFSDASGYLPEKAAPLIENGWECLTEAYLNEGPTLTPERLHFTATQKLGWPSSQPVFGTYGGWGLEDYEPYFGWPGWSCYLSEYLEF